MNGSLMGPPRGSWASGESGGTSRLNVDEVNSLCDLVAERECDVTHRHTLLDIYRRAISDSSIYTN